MVGVTPEEVLWLPCPAMAGQCSKPAVEGGGGDQEEEEDGAVVVTVEGEAEGAVEGVVVAERRPLRSHTPV